MRYSLIEEYNIQNGEVATVSLWTQGCPIRCKGCHNQHTWNFAGGKKWSDEAMDELLYKMERGFLKDLSILGGEPLAPRNEEDVIDICKKVREKYSNKVKIFVWTGYEKEQIKDSEIWNLVDIIVSGPFMIDKKKEHRWYGSTNQKIYCLNEEAKDLVGEEGILLNEKLEEVKC